MKRVRLKVFGRVQGVFYRQSAADHARFLGLAGWVANLEDGSVEIHAQGPQDRLESLIIWCQKGPPNARVDDIELEWIDELDLEFNDFKIRR